MHRLVRLTARPCRGKRKEQDGFLSALRRHGRCELVRRFTSWDRPPQEKRRAVILRGHVACSKETGMAVKDLEPIAPIPPTAPATPSAPAQEAAPAAAAPVYREDALETMGESRVRWEAARAKSESRSPYWKSDFTTVSGMDIPLLVTPEQTADIDPLSEIRIPGEFPYTRGIHPTGYRGKLWTMRQFAGFSTPEETNARFKYLLEQGQTGLS